MEAATTCFGVCRKGCVDAKKEGTMRAFLDAKCMDVCSRQLALHPETLDMTACKRTCAGEHVVEAEERVVEVCDHACGALKAGKLPLGSPCRTVDAGCEYTGSVKVTAPCDAQCVAMPDGTHKCAAAKTTGAPARRKAEPPPPQEARFWPTDGLLSTVASAAKYHNVSAAQKVTCTEQCACASSMSADAVKAFRDTNHPLAGASRVYVHADGSVGREPFTTRYAAAWTRRRPYAAATTTAAPGRSSSLPLEGAHVVVATTDDGLTKLTKDWSFRLTGWQADCFAAANATPGAPLALCHRPCAGACSKCPVNR